MPYAKVRGVNINYKFSATAVPGSRSRPAAGAT